MAVAKAESGSVKHAAFFALPLLLALEQKTLANWSRGGVLSVELFKDDDKRLRRRGIVHGWLKPFLLAAALIFLAVLASHGAEDAPKKADYVDPVTGMEFVLVKGGEFEMGDWLNGKQPLKKVRVGDYYIGKYEVTRLQWQKIMGGDPVPKEEENIPATKVNWTAADQFVLKLSKITGKTYRLPTIAEWEFAATGRGKKQLFAGFSDINKISEYAWNKDMGQRLTQVGKMLPNDLGIYDMTGNAAELCLDALDKNQIKFRRIYNDKDGNLTNKSEEESWKARAKALKGWNNLITTAHYRALLDNERLKYDKSIYVFDTAYISKDFVETHSGWGIMGFRVVLEGLNDRGTGQ